jgi:glyoxylase-like metal-dependent hydrolase (beta-lactamase superfamily II)
VTDVVISHLHYDHCGNHSLFPQARYHLQDREMMYATGRYMCHGHQRIPFEADDVVAMVRRVFDDRVVFHNGDEQLAPGLTVHHVGGHSMGLQCLRVATRRGHVVLAADATHLYSHIEQGRVFPVCYSVAETLEGYATIKRLADSPGHIVPGHDPDVLKRYPAAAPGSRLGRRTSSRGAVFRRPVDQYAAYSLLTGACVRMVSKNAIMRSTAQRAAADVRNTCITEHSPS